MGIVERLAAAEGSRRAEFFREHRVLMVAALVAVTTLPMWLGLLALGVPLVPASIGMGTATVVGCYAAYRMLDRPDDPGWVVQALRRLGGF